MRALLVLLSCTACNALLGIDETQERPIDAAIDAPHYACDPLPKFTTVPVKIVAGLAEYTADLHDDTIETAWNGTAIQEEVPGQGPFVDSMFANASSNVHNEAPRLAPSGEQLFVRTNIVTAGSIFFRIFGRGGTQWTNPTAIMFDPTTAILVTPTDIVSTPTQGESQRHVVIAHAVSSKVELEEWYEQSPTVWKPGPVYKPDMFGLVSIDEPYLSSDGLAMMFVGTSASARDVYIMVRIGDENFDPAQASVLYHPPAAVEVHAPFLNRDCSRLYFSTPNGVFYVPH